VPELVDMAGGADGFGRPGVDSPRLAWDDVRRYDPEVILVMPCSFTITRIVREFPLLKRLPGWKQVSAVRAGRVFAVEGAFFHRPGPRLVTGLTLMAALFHPTLFPSPPANQAKASR
jgi:iron complex transport system substrate-binding protein